MNDRDRLAADLLNVGVDWAVYTGDETWDTWAADRLIALGWTRLDEERLARTLAPLLPQHLEGQGGYPHQSSHRIWTVYDWMTPEEAAAAVAKAYREDTDGLPEPVGHPPTYQAADTLRTAHAVGNAVRRNAKSEGRRLDTPRMGGMGQFPYVGARVIVAAEHDRIGTVIASYKEFDTHTAWIVQLDTGQTFAVEAEALTETTL